MELQNLIHFFIFKSFSTDSEVFEKIINVNFLGIVRLTNLVLSYMIKDNDKNTKLNLPKRNFSIVNIGSVQSYLGIPYRSACMIFEYVYREHFFLYIF